MTIDLPETGNSVVDAACADVADLSDVPLPELAERLSLAHEQISSVLQHAPLVALPDRRPDRR
ncbi:MAG TPA: hypothetical protein PKM36_12000 [Propionibacteriaceae bacterium]|nr:hypothetical protein [Propionibacteriaceae bacterium]HPZ50792.1 hypothetical protein [Propionibacteriaceae bacterium]HQE32121.1 hypothetical protein [Propionibacteriaceae bacterium]